MIPVNIFSSFILIIIFYVFSRSSRVFLIVSFLSDSMSPSLESVWFESSLHSKSRSRLDSLWDRRVELFLDYYLCVCSRTVIAFVTLGNRFSFISSLIISRGLPRPRVSFQHFLLFFCICSFFFLFIPLSMWVFVFSPKRPHTLHNGKRLAL